MTEATPFNTKAVQPILEKLEGADGAVTLTEGEAGSVLQFISILSMTADNIATHAAGLENHIDDLNNEKKKGLWTPDG